MTLVKGPNGIVFDVAPSVASGLISGGHVEAVESDAEVEVTADESEGTSTEDEDTQADQAEESDAEVEENEEESEESSADQPAKPAGNASKGDWEAYALSQGFGEEQLDGLKQREIRDLFDE